MKKIKYCFLAAIILASTQVNAQFHLGIKAGTNVNKIDGVAFDKGFNFNYLAGAFIEIGGDGFAVAPEVIFSQSTATYSSAGKDIVDLENDQLKSKLNYLSIPVLANIKIAGPLHLELGPQYSILTNKDETLLENGKNAFKNGEFSAVGGLKVNIAKFRISGRYVVGLSDVSDIGDKDKWKNQALQLSVGLALF